jgi:hypothetical protein
MVQRGLEEKENYNLKIQNQRQLVGTVKFIRYDHQKIL